ncbi:MAG: aminopeptidase P family protein [Syntrophaceae bacterium]|nr:aminopeptidase P family protein [Syntrophaceae bacterium]
MIEPVKIPPPGEELELRMNKVRALMAREGLDCYVAGHTDNVYYLTNFAYVPFERPFFLVIPLDGVPVLILPGLEVSHAESRVLLPVEYRTYYEFPAPKGRTYVDVLRDVIPGGARVGIEPSLSIAQQAVMPGRLKAVDVIDEARLVKTDYEAGRIAYASRVVNAGLAKCFELSKPGAMEMTLYGDSVRQMMGVVLMEIPNANLLVSKFLCAVWPKKLSAQPHSVPGLFEQLEEGGPNVVIVTAQADGYSAELERTYFLGRVPEDSRRPFEACMEARALAYELVKPGAVAAEVDEAVLNLLKRRGYGDAILHRTGHGFGITGHEPPWIALGSGDVLEKNMVISIEPGIYLPDVGGFRHSDTVLVTGDGCLSLTTAPDRLEEVVLPV